MTSLEQLSLMMMRIKKMGAEEWGRGMTRSPLTSQCLHVRSRHPVSSRQISRPSFPYLYIHKQESTQETRVLIEMKKRKTLVLILFFYVLLRCWEFIHVLCDLSVVTWGSMSQCHGHCNASCHMSHTGHYTLHYNTASINHYTMGSDGSLPNNAPLSTGHLVTWSIGGGRGTLPLALQWQQG